MNPSDEDTQQTAESEQTQEEINELLEPKAIPDERIVRHAESNDSYRESPTLGNDEEIIQPPLEVEVMPPEVQERSDDVTVRTDTTPVAQTAEVRAAPEEVTVNKQEDHLITQEEILSSAFEEKTTSEQVKHDDQSMVQVPPTLVEEELVISTDVQPTQSVPQTAIQEGVEPVVYHTVSGGPETIQDKMTAQHAHDALNAPPVDTTTPHLVSSSSGYTIPNPNYIEPVQGDRTSSSNFGVIFILVVLVLVGGSLAYLYFFMPQEFTTMYDAMTVIFSEIRKKFGA